MKSKMKLPIKFLNDLCGPAQLYLVLSLFSLLILFYQNYSNPKKYCVGIFETKSDCNNRFYFVFKLLYIAIWLFILQKLCSKGYSTMSWILVLLPIIAMFILTGLILIVLMKKNNEL
jgi:hypothetical protein